MRGCCRVLTLRRLLRAFQTLTNNRRWKELTWCGAGGWGAAGVARFALILFILLRPPLLLPWHRSRCTRRWGRRWLGRTAWGWRRGLVEVPSALVTSVHSTHGGHGGWWPHHCTPILTRHPGRNIAPFCRISSHFVGIVCIVVEATKRWGRHTSWRRTPLIGASPLRPKRTRGHPRRWRSIVLVHHRRTTATNKHLLPHSAHTVTREMSGTTQHWNCGRSNYGRWLWQGSHTLKKIIFHTFSILNSVPYHYFSSLFRNS